MITVTNLTRRKIDEKFLRGLAKKVLKEENREIENLSIVFVGKRRIWDLNKKYRKKDKPTDVLSFGDELNEIVIYPTMTNGKNGIAKVLIHGILHLLGYDHEKNEKEAQKMEEKQRYYLNFI